MENALKRKKERFHYCMPMEISEWEFYGQERNCHGIAEAFSDYKYFKKRARALLKKIDKRINDVVTHDEIFKLKLINDLKNLDREFKDVSLKNDNGIDIIGYFFRLVAHLLGWAHFEGKFYRTPIYHQTKEQQDEDLRKSSRLKIQTGIYECFKRRHIIINLLSEENSYPVVALIMGMTVANVKSLEKNEFIDDLYKSSYEKEDK